MDYSTPEVDTLFVVTGFGGIKTSSSLRGGNLSNGSAGTCQQVTLNYLTNELHMNKTIVN